VHSLVLVTFLAAAHIELEARPAAVFPYLARLGTVDLDVYPNGVRADTIWIDAFSRNGSDTITIVNPVARMYADVPVESIAALLRRFGTIGSIEQSAIPQELKISTGTVGEIPATRYRFQYGPAAWIDLWTTTSVPENPQFQRIVAEFVTAISPGTGSQLRNIRGMPILVEMNFRRFKKVTLLRVRAMSADVSSEKDALTIGPLYVRSRVSDSLFK
jgi:hypothetical protein